MNTDSQTHKPCITCKQDTTPTRNTDREKTEREKGGGRKRGEERGREEKNGEERERERERTEEEEGRRKGKEGGQLCLRVMALRSSVAAIVGRTGTVTSRT